MQPTHAPILLSAKVEEFLEVCAKCPNTVRAYRADLASFVDPLDEEITIDRTSQSCTSRELKLPRFAGGLRRSRLSANGPTSNTRLNQSERHNRPTNSRILHPRPMLKSCYPAKSRREIGWCLSFFMPPAFASKNSVESTSMISGKKMFCWFAAKATRSDWLFLESPRNRRSRNGYQFGRRYYPPGELKRMRCLSPLASGTQQD